MESDMIDVFQTLVGLGVNSETYVNYIAAQSDFFVVSNDFVNGRLEWQRNISDLEGTLEFHGW